MQHDFIVFVTDGEWEAQGVQKALQSMRKSPLLGISHAILAKERVLAGLVCSSGETYQAIQLAMVRFSINLLS